MIDVLALIMLVWLCWILRHWLPEDTPFDRKRNDSQQQDWRPGVRPLQPLQRTSGDKVYMATNEGMPGLVKIGITRRSVAERLREMDTTGAPYPYECPYAAYVENAEQVEAALHRQFDSYRCRENREWFQFTSDEDAMQVFHALRKYALQTAVVDNRAVPRGAVSKRDISEWLGL